MKTFSHFLLISLAAFAFAACSGGHHKTEPKEESGDGAQGATELLGGNIESNQVDDSPIVFKFFLERSGSMTAYDSRTTKGDFKAAITDLLNGIPAKSNDISMLYVVNSGVFPYKESFKNFIMCKDIFAATKNLGDPRYTDFTCIFDSLLTRTGKNEISILASDLIYSTKEMSNVSVEKIQREARTLTTTVFKGHNDLKDVLLVKLNSDFDGKYYVYNKPSVGQAYKGNRPFYFVLVADHSVMEKLFSDKKYADFRNFSKLTGYENYYLFAAVNAAAPYYSVLSGDSHGTATKFSFPKGQNHAIHNIEDLEPNREGEVRIPVAVDLGMVFMSEELKTDPESYEIVSKSNYEIEEIIPITDEMKAVSKFKRYAGSATHLMVLHTTADEYKRVDKIKIRMPNQLPEWIHESSSDDDTNLKARNFAHSTFCLEYLCQGIYDAYYSSVDDPCFFELNINIK